MTMMPILDIDLAKNQLMEMKPINENEWEIGELSRVPNKIGCVSCHCRVPV